ncbi:MAG: hypothetical protein HZY74_12000 [Brevundimonas sp.]|nr:MAG: hypothetical protein HZY74_12000 [Brevundimonas sp.]
MSHSRTPPLATSRALDAAMALSARLQMVAITLLLLMSVQFVVASYARASALCVPGSDRAITSFGRNLRLGLTL